MRRLLPYSKAAFGLLAAFTLLTAALTQAQDPGTTGAGTPQAAPQTSGGATQYVVEQGDVLDLIAAKFNVSIDCLKAANNLPQPWRIFPGEVITIPGNCPAYTGTAPILGTPMGVTLPSELPGGVAVNTTMNMGSDGMVRQPGPGDQTYVVVQGDNLDTIARRYNVSLQSLFIANGRPHPQRLFIGVTLVIPGDAPAYGAYPLLGDLPTVGPNEQIYIIQPLDVLDLIAAAFDKQLVCIIERNALEHPNLIFPGEAVVIPNSCPPYDGVSYRIDPRAVLQETVVAPAERDVTLVTATPTAAAPVTAPVEGALAAPQQAIIVTPNP